MTVEEKPTQAESEHSNTFQFRHLVLDAAPLFSVGGLSAGIAEHFVTVPEVLVEVRDAISREALDRLPYKLEVRGPSVEALKMVQDFAKATGDVAVLSPTDIKVLALAVTIDLELNGKDSKIRSVPRVPKIHETGSSVAASRGSDKPKPERRRRGGQEVTSFEEEPEEEKAEEVEPEAESDSDAGEWITPDNIEKFKGIPKWNGKSTVTAPKKQVAVPVALVSSDFAVQNVALQMRLRLYSPDGLRIKRLQNWLLRCHACYHLTREMERRFCPKCGGPTLLRTSYSVNAQGQTVLYLRSDFQYNLRGTKYSLPAPKSTSNKQQPHQSKKIFLREDQVEYERALRTYQRQQRKAEKGVSLDVVDDRLAGLFGEMKMRNGDGTAKAYFEGIAPPVVGFGRRNPNQARRTAK